VPKPEIVDYDPTWPQRFEAFAARIRDALGPRALRVDHIGSTSIPNLAAKDVIDIQVTVADLDASLVPDLEAVGFRGRREIVRDHVPPGRDPAESGWTKRYLDVPDDGVHVHVRIAGRANQRYPLLFRDYLRAYPDAAAAYGEAKRRLAALCDDTGIYADAKDPICDIIISAAEDWAVRTGWNGA
jgi:GrpB-like predicted nucleotidyltransferase (UPF0157 family)